MKKTTKQTTKKTTKTNRPKRNIRSFEADDDIQQLLERTEKAGVVVTRLINRALRRFLKNEMGDEAKRMRESADILESQNTSEDKR